jgi:hypothetical protein
MPYETPTCWDNFLFDLFGLWSMQSEISNSFFSVSVDGIPDLVASHRTGFLEFLNQLPHSIMMWHLGLWKLCLESLLNILCIFSTTLKHMFR